jgi:hypothetical protein
MPTNGNEEDAPYGTDSEIVARSKDNDSSLVM